MPTSFQLIDREIMPKGKCYLILTEYDEADFASVLQDLVSFALQSGAREVYVASRCVEQPFYHGVVHGGFCFQDAASFDFYEKCLQDSDVPISPLRIKYLKPFLGELYKALYNETFFPVPNAQTLDDEGLAELLNSTTRKAGFFMVGGAPVGVFELDTSEEIPEIAAIAILSGEQHKGYAKQGLRLLERELYRQGHRRAKLLVASTNTPAIHLYMALGYEKTKRLSTWFSVSCF